jgi:hypothetical protein
MKNIKAFVQIGLMKQPKWLKGTLIKRDDQNSTVSVSGQTLVVENTNVKEFRELSYANGVCEEIENFKNQNWEELKTVVTDALAKFFPNQEIRADEEEKILYIGPDDDLTIGPSMVERKTIVSFIEQPCWTVTFYKMVYSYSEPPDADEVNCGDSTTSIGIARILVDTLWRFKTEEYFETISLDKWSESEF